MNGALGRPLRMPEVARTGVTFRESQFLGQGRRYLDVPPVAGLPRPVRVLQQECTRLPIVVPRVLCGKFDICRVFRIGLGA